MGASAAWADEYRIVFKTNTSDGSTAIASNVKVATVVSAGTQYVSGFTGNCFKAYYSSKSGVKLGSSSAAGIFEFNIAEAYQSNVTSVTVKTTVYGSDESSLTLEYNGDTKAGDSFTPGTDYEYTFDNLTTLTSLKISSTKRSYVSEVIITTSSDTPGGGTTPTTYSVNIANDIANGTVTASTTTAAAGATVTLTATPADGYEFTSWKVTLVDDDSAVTVKDNKFTMPEGDVNVSAVFTAQEATPVVPSEHTIVCKDVTWIVGKDENEKAQTLSVTANGYTILCQKNNGATAPGYLGGEGNYDVRVYAKGTITISSEIPFTGVVFNISTQGLKRLAPITADCGKIASQSLGDDTVTWTSNEGVTSVTFTVGDKANYGSEGETKAGQLDFTSIDIVAGEAPTTIGTLVKYIDGLLKGEGSFNELQNIVNSILGK